MEGISLSSILALISTYFIFVVLFFILQIIANWKIYTKAGEGGWKSLIPVYNSYMKFKIAWKTGVFWLSIACAVAAAILPNISSSNTMVIITAFLTLIIGIIEIVLLYKMSCAFGHGIGFTLGLIFFNPIFILILAFGSSKYQGPQ